MFFLFKEKNISDPVKIRKFYYYSPEKLKLVPINNLGNKIIISLVGLFIITSLFNIFIQDMFFNENGKSSNVLNTQKVVLDSETTKEINELKEKFQHLQKKYVDLVNSSNDLRIVNNLVPVEFDVNNFGTGGSDVGGFDNFTTDQSKAKLGSIYETINKIELTLNYEANNYKEIEDKFKSNTDLFDKIPAIKPVNSYIGDRFGMRYHPILKRRKMHFGLDFLANTGEKIFAPGDGVVTFVGKKGGYGKVIRINHGYGYETLYAHLSKYKVKKGQKVKRGDIIALSGNSGSLSTGPHLHYEVRHNGVCLNPSNFIFDDLKLFDTSKKKFLASK